MKLKLGLLVACVGLLHAQETTGSIRGVVWDGPAVAEIDVDVVLESARGRTHAHSQHGAYEFEKLPPGDYWLTFTAGGRHPFKAKVALLPGEQKELPIVGLRIESLLVSWESNLRPTGTQFGGLFGTVYVGPVPAANARVTLFCDDTLCATATANAEGKFEISDPPAGRYEIRISRDGFLQRKFFCLTFRPAGQRGTHSI